MLTGFVLSTLLWKYPRDINSKVDARKSVNPVDVLRWSAFYIHLGEQLVGEYKAGTTYFLCQDQLASSRFLTSATGTGARYYHPDHLGSTRLITDASGNPISSLDYYPFGEEWDYQSSANHYKFTGKERDSESGLDNFGARYNSSNLGRFMSPDPENAGASPDNPQSWNAYSYVLNNPLILIDPDGLDCVYLNNAGNGVEEVDTNSTKTECTDPSNGGTWFDGTIDASSVRTDSDSNWVYASGSNGSNSQYSCTGDACGQDTLSPFVNSITGGPSSATASDTLLNPFATSIFAQVFKADHSLRNPCTPAAFYLASAQGALATNGIVGATGATPPFPVLKETLDASTALRAVKTVAATAGAAKAVEKTTGFRVPLVSDAIDQVADWTTYAGRWWGGKIQQTCNGLEN